jgi:hypothetical protein
MIPKTIHYCWFGRGEMPQLAKDCIASWHRHMPDWNYKLWNEDNFDVDSIPYTKEAYATEYGSASTAEESKRKRRIAAGGLQSIWWLRSLLNPISHPKVTFQYVSHRVLRWSITPFALFSLVPLNLLLLLLDGSIIYQVIIFFQFIFYLSALIGHILKKAGHRNKLLYIPTYFFFMNLNVFLGIRYLMTHNSSGTWEKARRG